MTTCSIESTQDLIHFLSENIAEFSERLDKAIKEEEEEPTDEYWVFYYVIRPLINSMLEEGREDQLTSAIKVLETIANTGSASVTNELRVVLFEDVETHRFYCYMGPTLRADWFDSITWIDEWSLDGTDYNAHVDKVQYRKRWKEEIEKIGGFANLSSDEECRIGNMLFDEFSMQRCTSEMLGELMAQKRNEIEKDSNGD